MGKNKKPVEKQHPKPQPVPCPCCKGAGCMECKYTGMVVLVK